MQQKNQTAVNRPKRWLAMLLAVITVISLLPVMALPAAAATAPPTVSLVNIDGSPPSYTSGSGLGTVYIQPFTVNAGGKTVTAFCADHAKHIGPSAIGNTWNLDSSKTVNSVALPFLDWYYDNESKAFQLEQDNPALSEQEIANAHGVGYWDSWTRRLASNLPRVAVWLSNSGTLNSLSASAQLDMLAQEYSAAYAAAGGTMTLALARSIIDAVIADWNSGTITKNQYHIYQHSTNSTYYQPVLVPIFPVDELTDYPVYLRLRKTDGAAPLAGAIFGIYSDPACTNSVGQISSTATEWSISSEIVLKNSPTATLYVKEVYAPAGHAMDDTVYPVSVNSAQHGTAATAAAVNSGAPIVNTPTITPPGQFKIIKLAAGTTRGLAGAIFDVYYNNVRIGSYTSDASGTVVVQNVRPGIYTIVERVPPANHLLSGNPTQTITVTQYDIDESIPITVTYENDPYGSLQLTKRSSPSNAPVQNVMFLVRHISTGFEFTMTTDASGTAFRDRLQPGAYEIRELSVPEHIIIDVTPKTVNVVSGQTAGAAFVNNEKVGLTIYKYDETSRASLAGIVFEIYKDGTLFATRTTDAQGQIRLTNLEPGTYLAKEVASGSSHVLNSTPQQIELTAGSGTKELVFLNKLKPGMWLVKLDSQTMLPISGVKFRIEKVGGTYNQEHTSDALGEIDLSALEPGAYLVTELVANGYVIDNASRLVQLNAGETARFVFTNTKKPNLEIIKADARTGALLPGAVFTIRKVGETATVTVTSGSTGAALLEGLEPGVYEVTEKTPPTGYLPGKNPTQLVTLEPGKTAVVRFENEPKPSLTIMKTDAQTGLPLAGARFEVKEADGQALSGSPYTTGADGKVVITLLEPMKLSITEIKAPEGYLIDDAAPRIITIEPGEDMVVSFTDTRKPDLTIKKVDSITGDSIKGAKFAVYFYGENMNGAYENLGTFYTDESGEITLPKQRSGWYRLVEEAPAPGYAMPQINTQDVFLKPGEDRTVTFENVPLSALIIRKINSDTGLPVSGTAFRVRYLGGTSGSGGTIIYEGVTSHNGTIVLTGLKAGTYIAEEYRAAPGYELSNPSSKTAYLTGNDQDVVTLEFSNARQGQLVIQKLSSLDNRPLAGAKFKVTDSAGTAIGPNNGIYTTDASGLIKIAEFLPVGSTIIVQEITAPNGYVLDTNAQTIKIKENTTHTLTFYNTPEGSLQIIKSDVQSGARISSTRYEVRKISGEIVGVFDTNAQGVITVSGLESGWYTAVETKANKNYILDATPHNIEVKDGQTATLRLTNEPISGILIYKVSSTTGEGLYGVSFLLSDSRHNPIGRYTSDQSGRVYITGLKDGKYYLSELEAAPGYIRDTQEKTVWIEGGTTEVITWKNTPMLGQLQILKKSGDDNQINGLSAGTPLSGAVFEIYSYKTGQLVDRIVSGANGWAVSKPLPLDRYLVKEVQAPAYYKLSEQALDLTVEFASQVVRAEYLNYSANTGVYIRKTGNVEATPGTTIAYDFHGIANTSTVPLSDFYWRDTLPVDAVRLNRIVTGTYNQALKYKIVGYTSSGRSIVIADNLSTTQNHVVDCSPLAVGLNSGEIFTSFSLHFGTVKAGFTQVSAPKVYVDVLPSLGNAYQFVNKADVGGKYNNEWIITNTTWTTKVYNPGWKLPKTGY